MTYAKPHLELEAQVGLLRDRGIVVESHERARKALQAVNYYRFTGYAYPFRVPAADGGTRYSPGLKFDELLRLIAADDKLRQSLARPVEHLELGMRFHAAHELGRSGPHAHLDPNLLDVRRCSQPSRAAPGSSRHDDWMERIETKVARARAKQDPVVIHYDRRYGGDLPLWVLVEILDFGDLVQLIELCPNRVRSKIAKALGAGDGSVLTSWLKSANDLRNRCAHHGRIANYRVLRTPSEPSPHGDKSLLDEFQTSVHDARLAYATILVVVHMASALRPDEFRNYRDAVKTALRETKLPDLPDRTYLDMVGFPAGWRQSTFWA